MDLGLSAVGARVLRTRWLVRAPIRLYRVGLGRLLGRRVLMLEHRGRRSGLPRQVCLEVVERPAEDRVVIVSGFGTSSDWYRNLQAEPGCRVSVGRLRRVPARARFLGEHEASEVIARYQVAHPGAWRGLRGAIEKAVGHPVGDLPMVELRLDLPG